MCERLTNMEHKRRWAVACLVIGAACGGATDTVLEDAGELLSDAGQALIDAGDSDASAQPPSEVECVPRTRTIEYSNGSTLEGTQWYATVPVRPGATEIHAVLCNRERLAPIPSNCPTNATCTGHHTYTAEESDCEYRSGASRYGDEFVFFCGSTNTTRGPDGTESTSGYRWRSVRIYQN